jgi:hypothetical protein
VVGTELKVMLGKRFTTAPHPQPYLLIPGYR